MQARVADGEPPPPQQAARRGHSQSAAAATGRKGIVAAGGGGQGKRGGREDTKTEGRRRPEQYIQRIQQSTPRQTQPPVLTAISSRGSSGLSREPTADLSPA
ncbi:uncharacterized protein LOC104662034 isoform X1 [Rhinopithecus roxellana]|uniref:uncharacterized protein LOC104662034 isoform X1 n=1 Tax=Rhinopithecus roxellana TaxID=61622 RepID=UPI0012374C40|nr:uncharacterized protein LOC104662034 isoform X1 [Rhinopithecus roxellana]